MPQSDMCVATYLSQKERLHRTVDLCRAAGVYLSLTPPAHTLINPAYSCELCRSPLQASQAV